MHILLWIIMHVAILIATIMSVTYIYFRNAFKYWKKRNIPYAEPSFPLGSIKGSNSKNFSIMLRKIYEKSKNERLYGIYTFYKPSLMINDLDLVKDILVKDFMNFHDRGGYHNEEVDPLSGNLALLQGSKWRNIRTKLSPTFTSGKMKIMFPIIKTCSDQLREVLTSLAEKDEVVEMKDVIARFTTDIIASCAFGIEANSLKNPNVAFRTMGRKLFQPSWRSCLRNIGTFIVPEFAKFIKMRVIPKELADFFLNILRDTIEFREKNNITRNDFLQLLIQLMNKGYLDDADGNNDTGDKQKFKFEEAAPQAFIFFIAGSESSSMTMQFLLYELALNQDVQEKLRQEVQQTLAESKDEMTYENVHKMEYMGRVIDETLRKWPAAVFIPRICTKTYQIPGTDILVEKGDSVLIPVYGFHMDENYFPEPDKFDPDRFTEEAKATRHYYAYLPFGEGPRICIAQRFAMMQMRVALATIMNYFKVSIANGITPVPMELDPKGFHLSPKGGMHLRLSRVKGQKL